MQKSIVFGKVLALALLAMVTTTTKAGAHTFANQRSAITFHDGWQLQAAGSGYISFRAQTNVKSGKATRVRIGLSPSKDKGSGVYLAFNELDYRNRIYNGTDTIIWDSGKFFYNKNINNPLAYYFIAVQQPRIIVWAASDSAGTGAVKIMDTSLNGYQNFKYFSFSSWTETVTIDDITSAANPMLRLHEFQGNVDKLTGWLNAIIGYKNDALDAGLRAELDGYINSIHSWLHSPSGGAKAFQTAATNNADNPWAIFQWINGSNSVASQAAVIMDKATAATNRARQQVAAAAAAAAAETERVLFGVTKNAAPAAINPNIATINAAVDAIKALVAATTDAELKTALNGFLTTAEAQKAATAESLTTAAAAKNVAALNQTITNANNAAALASAAKDNATKAKSDADNFARNKAAAQVTISGDAAAVQASIDAINAALNATAGADIKANLNGFLKIAQAQLALITSAKTASAAAATAEALNKAIADASSAAATAADAQKNAIALPSLIIPVDFDEEVGKSESIAVGGNAIYCVSFDGKQLFSYNNHSMSANPWEAVALSGLPNAVLLEAVACGGDNTTCILDANGTVYTLAFAADMKTAACTVLPSVAVTPARIIVGIAVGDAKNIWAVDNSKNVLRHNGKDWIIEAATVGHDVAVGGDGHIVSINTEGDPFFFSNGKWSKLPDLPNGLNIDQIAVVTANNLYAVSEDARLWHFAAATPAAGQPAAHAAWTVLKNASGKDAKGFKNVSANAGGTVFATAVNDEIYNTDVQFVVVKPVAVAAAVTTVVAGATVVSKKAIAKVAVKKGKLTRGQARKNKQLNIKDAKKQVKNPARKMVGKVKQANQTNKADAKVEKAGKNAGKKAGKNAGAKAGKKAGKKGAKAGKKAGAKAAKAAKQAAKKAAADKAAVVKAAVVVPDATADATPDAAE